MQAGFQRDPSEDYADSSTLHAQTLSEDERVEQSVWNEPGFSPELADSTQRDVLLYGEWLRKRWNETSYLQSWLYTLILALCSGFWGVFGTFLGSGSSEGYIGLFVVVVFGPIIEETMKTAMVLWYLEKKPYVFKSQIQIILCVVIGAFVFAAIENVLYIFVYIFDPSSGLIQWRWTVCTLLHMGCTFVASLGLVHMWRDIWQNESRPNISLAYPYLLTAVIIHGGYNLFAIFLEIADYQF